MGLIAVLYSTVHTKLLSKQFNVFHCYRYLILMVLWAILAFMLYKVFTADKDYVEYNPFEILKIDPVGSVPQIAWTTCLISGLGY